MTKIGSKIDAIRTQRGWTVYRLAEESGISKSAIHKWLDTDTIPSIPALEQICAAFGITMSEFFRDGNMAGFSPDLQEIIEAWAILKPEEKVAIMAIVRSYTRKRD